MECRSVHINTEISVALKLNMPGPQDGLVRKGANGKAAGRWLGQFPRGPSHAGRDDALSHFFEHTPNHTPNHTAGFQTGGRGQCSGFAGGEKATLESGAWP